MYGSSRRIIITPVTILTTTSLKARPILEHRLEKQHEPRGKAAEVAAFPNVSAADMLFVSNSPLGSFQFRQ